MSDFADYGSGGDNDWGGGNGSDDDDFLPQQIATSTLRDHLNGQLALLNLPLRDRHIVTALIDALDDDGYLPTPLEEIAELFPAELEIEPEELTIALKFVQSFEPAGVGARDCAECLALQLKTLPADTPFMARCAQGRRRPPAAARQPRFHEAEARCCIPTMPACAACAT